MASVANRSVGMIALLFIAHVTAADQDPSAMARYRDWIDADGFVAYAVDVSKLTPDEKTVYERYRRCLDHNMQQMKAYATQQGLKWQPPTDEGYVDRSVPRWAYPLYGADVYRERAIALGLPKKAACESLAVAAEKPGRVPAKLFLQTRKGWMPVGQFWLPERHHVSYHPHDHGRDIRFRLPFPHDRYNLSTGGKLKKGIVGGSVTIDLRGHLVYFHLKVGALQNHRDGLPIGLCSFDGDQFDDAFVWLADADGAVTQHWLDLGVEPGLKEPPADQTFPCPAGNLMAHEMFFLTRDGLAVRFRAKVTGVRGMTRWTEARLRAHGRIPLGNVHAQLGGQFLSLLVDYDAFLRGAGLNIAWRLTIHDLTRFGPLPRFDHGPVDWGQARFFDSHGHADFRHNLVRSARALRKNRMVFGILGFNYCEGPRGRKFLGDWPAYVAFKNFPDVFSGFGCIQLNPTGYPGCPASAADKPEKVDLLHRLGFHGIKNIEKWASDVPVDDPKFDGLYRRMQAHNMPIVYHAGYGPRVGEPGGYGHSTAHLSEVARRFPKLFVGIAHGGTPSGGKRLAASDNPLERYVYRYLKSIPNLHQQHMHYSTLEAALPFQERGLLRKLVYGTDAQMGPGVDGATRFLRILREMRASKEEIAWCCAGYMTSPLRGRWPRPK